MALDSSTSLLDKIPLLPDPKGKQVAAATTGTKAQKQLVCDDQLTRLQELRAKAEKVYREFVAATDLVEGINADLNLIAPKIFEYNRPKIEAARSLASRVMEDVQDVCDVAKPEKMYVTKGLVPGNFGVATPAFVVFQVAMLSIGAEATKIKVPARLASYKTSITNTVSNTEELTNFPFQKFQYKIDLYMILPGGKKVNVDQYMREFLYTRLFDTNALPIYSIMFNFPQTVMSLIKLHNENIKWFISIDAVVKQFESSANTFKIPQSVIRDAQLIPVDPKFNPPQGKSGSADTAVPIYPFKIDLVPHKDTTLNSKVKARVFTNATLLEVLTTLAGELKTEYAKRQEDSKKDVKFSIAPPDNIGRYEQILVEPGSFTRVVDQLQAKYGIYYTGVRVSFDSIQAERSAGGGVSNFTQVTILGKGDSAPTEKAIKDCIIELVDPRAVENPAYDSGQYLDNETGTVILRTYLPYVVTRSNSDSLVSGESIRVMNSSASDHLASNCDNEDTDTNTQRMYWSNYDNPFALTQLQDSVKEKHIEFSSQFRDINSLIFNDNLNYTVRFFGEDDKVYTGDYRLTAARFYFKNGATVNMYNKNEIETVLSFANVPPLRINGVEVIRPTYGEKLAKIGGASGKGGSGFMKQLGIPNVSAIKNMISTAIGGFVDSAIPKATYEGGPPFRTNFYGKTDYNGMKIPEMIPATWKMSNNTTLKDVYEVTFDANPEIGYRLCNSYQYFVNAQRFGREVIDKCHGLFGTLGEGGKLKSWYRYKIPDSSMGSSEHLIALACDSTWGSGDGDALAERFFKLINSGIDFDQLILEGDGSKWSFIHISKQMNGTNRKDIKLSFSGIQGDYKRLNKAKLSSKEDLVFKKAIKVCF